MTEPYDPGADAAARYPQVTVRHRRLGGIPAASDRRRRVILIERDASRAQRRCWLAHEIAHLDLEHDGCAVGIEECRRELRADRLAARRLINLERLAEALQWALGPDEVANELDVTTHLAAVRIRDLTPAEKRWIEVRIDSMERSA